MLNRMYALYSTNTSTKSERLGDFFCYPRILLCVLTLELPVDQELCVHFVWEDEFGREQRFLAGAVRHELRGLEQLRSSAVLNLTTPTGAPLLLETVGLGKVSKMNVIDRPNK